MTFTLLAAALLAMPVAAPAQTAPAPAPAATTAPAAKLTIDSTVEAIAADPRGKAILDAQFPGMLAHESYPMFKGMSLKQLQPYSNGRVTDAHIATVTAELAKLN